MGRNHSTDLKDVWQTPDELLTLIGEIDVDPCAGEDTSIGSDANYTKADDGLEQVWHGRVFVNPPFSDKSSWIEKCVNEMDNTECIFLVTPDSTDTKSWWHKYIAAHADYIWFSHGRMSYINPETGETGNAPPFGTAVSMFGEPGDETLDRMKDSGHLVKTVK